MTSFARWFSAAVLALCLMGVVVHAQDKPDEDGKIAGLPVQRAGNHWFGIDASSGNFEITFYNEHKKPETPTPAITKAVLHWPVHYQPNEERTFLTLNGQGVLTSEKPVKAPHNFKLFISFFTDGQQDPVEEYVVDFHE